MDRTLSNARGETLAATWVDAPDGGDRVVVIGHGLTSDRDRPWSEALSAALAERGLASVRIAFAGNGDSQGSFVDSCVTAEVEDLGAVLDALDGRRIAYVGHSMGAAVGVLRAARDDRIEALVSLAGMVHTAEFFRRMFGGLALGDLLLDKPGKPLGATLRDDLLAIDSVLPRARDVGVPWLLVHGDADDVVPIEHSRDVAVALGGRVELSELPGVDHSFTGAGLTPMVTRVADWLAATLR